MLSSCWRDSGRRASRMSPGTGATVAADRGLPASAGAGAAECDFAGAAATASTPSPVNTLSRCHTPHQISDKEWSQAPQQAWHRRLLVYWWVYFWTTHYIPGRWGSTQQSSSAWVTSIASGWPPGSGAAAGTAAGGDAGVDTAAAEAGAAGTGVAEGGGVSSSGSPLNLGPGKSNRGHVPSNLHTDG